MEGKEEDRIDRTTFSGILSTSSSRNEELEVNDIQTGSECFQSSLVVRVKCGRVCREEPDLPFYGLDWSAELAASQNVLGGGLKDKFWSELLVKAT
jgi:hypothetical protein